MLRISPSVATISPPVERNASREVYRKSLENCGHLRSPHIYEPSQSISYTPSPRASFLSCFKQIYHTSTTTTTSSSSSSSPNPSPNRMLPPPIPLPHHHQQMRKLPHPSPIAYIHAASQNLRRHPARDGPHPEITLHVRGVWM